VKANNENANKFIQTLNREAERLSVQVLFGSGKTILSYDEKSSTDGYFQPPEDDSPGIIAVAIGQAQTKWLHTLAHEYAHMWQWFNDDPIWLEWQKRSNDMNYLRLEEHTENQACSIIEQHRLPCGDYRKRAEKYIMTLRKDLGLTGA